MIFPLVMVRQVRMIDIEDQHERYDRENDCEIAWDEFVRRFAG